MQKKSREYAAGAIDAELKRVNYRGRYESMKIWTC